MVGSQLGNALRALQAICKEQGVTLSADGGRVQLGVRVGECGSLNVDFESLDANGLHMTCDVCGRIDCEINHDEDEDADK